MNNDKRLTEDEEAESREHYSCRLNKKYTGSAALPYLSGEVNDGQLNIVCPICNHECTHIHDVGTLLGYDKEEAKTYQGTQVIGRTDYRRSALAIGISCEACWFVFNLIIQQHKGVNYLQLSTQNAAFIDHNNKESK